MHGRPVPRVVARLACRAGRGASSRLLQQIDGRIGAQHFRRLRSQSSMQGQSEGAPIEVDGVFKIGDIDIDQDMHRAFPLDGPGNHITGPALSAAGSVRAAR
ncbi:hypothetical protein G6F57_015043 [Rhizopus arrhizus]|nr:hypothetical protein G6F32_014985 [Rhizopus arrhizus]KAG1248846.1 hypothetical protein G6F65_019396 [Rhizopus arrhizus]KAG1456689.1 hypothetical protein G6F57_015043 [Rhizopus arrhizus]